MRAGLSPGARGNKLRCPFPWLNFLFVSLSGQIPIKGTPVPFHILNCVLAPIQGTWSSHSHRMVPGFDESSLSFSVQPPQLVSDIAPANHGPPTQCRLHVSSST